MCLARKDWNDHVAHAEEVARGRGFQGLRDEILEGAGATPEDVVVDVGSGTGLLTLALAPRVRRVWAVDIAPAMAAYLGVKAASAGLENVDVVVATATSLPLVDESADLVVSNYCFHHLSDGDKERALAEIHRVLRPGGRLVFGDMMFRISLAQARDRTVLRAKLHGLARKGPGGVRRIARNAVRVALGRGEQPARAEWWHDALARHGFDPIEVRVLEHEGGIALARRR
jgi:ubiquinone/menaquinone biosynthesis C-methylase UbiE